MQALHAAGFLSAEELTETADRLLSAEVAYERRRGVHGGGLQRSGVHERWSDGDSVRRSAAEWLREAESKGEEDEAWEVEVRGEDATRGQEGREDEVGAAAADSAEGVGKTARQLLVVSLLGSLDDLAVMISLLLAGTFTWCG
jgi:hypothetical protein